MTRRGDVRVRVVGVLVALGLAGLIGMSIAPSSDVPAPARRARPRSVPAEAAPSPAATPEAAPQPFAARPALPVVPTPDDAVHARPAAEPTTPGEAPLPTPEDVAAWSSTTREDLRAVLDTVPDEDLAYAESVVAVADRAVSRMAFGAQQGDIDARAAMEAIDRQRRVVVERLAERLDPKELGDVETLLATPMTGIGEVPRPGARAP